MNTDEKKPKKEMRVATGSGVSVTMHNPPTLQRYTFHYCLSTIQYHFSPHFRVQIMRTPQFPHLDREEQEHHPSVPPNSRPLKM